ncbi:MAG: TetR/AcrR family transcriptional regulator [Pseudomonadota bacterium]
MTRTAPASRARGGRRVARRSPEEARQEIIDAATWFLQRRPFREMTIGDLMSRTKIGRSAFYAYFKDVYAVVEALMTGIRDQVLTYFEAWRAEDLAPDEALRMVLSDTVNLWAVEGPMIAAMIDASGEDERLAEAFAGITAIYQETVAGILRRDVAAGRIRQIDCDEVAALLVTGTQAYLKVRLGHTGRRDPLKVAATLQDTWTHAIYAR